MYKHIMVPLDGSELAESALEHVIAIAGGCNVPKVTLVRVVTPLKLYGAEVELPYPDVQRLEESSMKVAGDYLAEQAEKLKKKGLQVQTQVLFGIVIDSLLEFADKNGVDMVVIATHGRSGISRWAWGSVADKILRSVKVPVFMVRVKGHRATTT
jgi:nucleotide-binding universal stress UspA family protein